MKETEVLVGWDPSARRAVLLTPVQLAHVEAGAPDAAQAARIQQKRQRALAEIQRRETRRERRLRIA